jgi:hypothetical protein
MGYRRIAAAMIAMNGEEALARFPELADVASKGADEEVLVSPDKFWLWPNRT